MLFSLLITIVCIIAYLDCFGKKAKPVKIKADRYYILRLKRIYKYLILYYKTKDKGYLYEVEHNFRVIGFNDKKI